MFVGAGLLSVTLLTASSVLAHAVCGRVMEVAHLRRCGGGRCVQGYRSQTAATWAVTQSIAASSGLGGILPPMETFITSAVAWTAAASWATFLVLASTLYFVYRQVAEATTLRREQTRPYVVVSIDVEQRSLFMLTVENIGKTPAFDVAIKFNEPLRSSMKEIEQVRMLREPIPMLPPGRRLRAVWEVSFTVFEKDYPYPLSYQATVKYKDQKGHNCGPETYVLDFRMYEGLAIGPKGVNELVNSVEKLHTEHKKWTSGISGLLVHTVDAAKKTRRQDRPYHLGQTMRTYSEDGWKAAIAYWGTVLRRRYGLWFR
ncbi:MAG: hypothetical protein ACRDRG_17580 [Pseudonocardiaceae bacterium]